jgi:hypothetical protein
MYFIVNSRLGPLSAGLGGGGTSFCATATVAINNNAINEHPVRIAALLFQCNGLKLVGSS